MMRRSVFDVRDFGAKGDGVFLDTAAINHAIAAAADAGGGVVSFPSGDFLSYSIRLKSRVTLQLSAGTRIIAAIPPRVGEAGAGYDAPEGGPDNHLQDFGHSHFQNSLIWGDGLEDVAIFGPGRIYGRGLSRGNGRVALPMGVTAPHAPDKLPDVLEADGDVPPTVTLDREPGPFGYPNSRDTLAPGIGNKAIGLKNCRNVVLRDFTILHGGHFGVLASGTENLTIDNLLIDTNRDGIDIDSCNNVRISNCSVNSPWDDGICLKASCGLKELRAVENVTISNCYVSGFVEGTLLDGTRSRHVSHRGGPIGRIKLGTEASGGFRNIAITNCVFEHCRGLALEQVDGGVLEDIVISNIVMRDVMNAPLFIRLGRRLRTPLTDAVGTVQRISVSNLVAYNVAPEQGVFIAGVAGNPVREIRLRGIELYFRGGGSEEEGRRVVPEMERDYPEPMLFGRLPSWGIYVRHAEEVRVSDVRLRSETKDERPVVYIEDLRGGSFADLSVAGAAGTNRGWVQNGVGEVRIRDCDRG